jgi:SAM-dependent methyltransferase
MTDNVQMIDQIAQTTPGTGAILTCDICQTTQSAPVSDDTPWKCRMCGQEYRSTAGGKRKSIVLSDRQIAALRTQIGRDASGRSTLTKNWWTENDQPVGEAFLDFNKDAPARHYTRKLILNWATAGQINSVLEIAFGGLHEYRAMRTQLKEMNVYYGGVDWTEKFVAHAQNEFPECRWTQGDIVRGVSVDPADVVYSQHMLEHLPALEPAFSNMLRLARKKLINMFFIPPKPFENYEVVNWQKFPLYHNTYSIGHIEHICRAMNFTCKWVPFPNDPLKPKTVGLGEDVVLIAERMEARA